MIENTASVLLSDTSQNKLKIHSTICITNKKNPGFSFVPKDVAVIIACLYQLVVLL